MGHTVCRPGDEPGLVTAILTVRSLILDTTRINALVDAQVAKSTRNPAALPVSSLWSGCSTSTCHLPSIRRMYEADPFADSKLAMLTTIPKACLQSQQKERSGKTNEVAIVPRTGNRTMYKAAPVAD